MNPKPKRNAARVARCMERLFAWLGFRSGHIHGDRVKGKILNVKVTALPAGPGPFPPAGRLCTTEDQRQLMERALDILLRDLAFAFGEVQMFVTDGLVKWMFLGGRFLRRELGDTGPFFRLAG